MTSLIYVVRTIVRMLDLVEGAPDENDDEHKAVNMNTFFWSWVMTMKRSMRSCRTSAKLAAEMLLAFPMTLLIALDIEF